MKTINIMEKYRIKVEAYGDGSVKYYPQWYRGYFTGWKSLQSSGEKAYYADCLNLPSREDALRAIDFCYNGKNIVIEITYEYIKQ